MLFMASGSSPRCSFQLRAQIQTVVKVLVSKLGSENNTGWRGPRTMAWTATLVRLVIGDHATWDRKSL